MTPEAGLEFESWVRLVTGRKALPTFPTFHFSFEHPFLATEQRTNRVTSRKSRIKILVEDEPFFCAACSYKRAAPSTFDKFFLSNPKPRQASTLLEILPWGIILEAGFNMATWP